MASPAFGIGYSLWLRLRWIFIATVALIALLALTAQLFPVAAEACCALSMPVVLLSMVPLLNVFSFGPADLGVKSSGFPTHMRTFPVSTRALVGWPMLFAAATVSVLWLLPACLIFFPAGLHPPIFWPATMLIALCVWVQAIGWSPFPSPFARVPVLVISFAPLTLPIALGLTFFEGNVSSAVMTATGLGWSTAAYVFGVMGVSRARAGNEGDWFRPITERWTARSRRRYVAGNRRPPFRSAFTAQLWHECRRNAIVLPIMTAFVGLPMLAVLCLSILDPKSHDTFLFGSTVLSPPMMALAIWIVGPFFLATTQGGGVAKCDVWGKIAMPAFFATRPLTTAQFLLIKTCGTAVCVLAVWAVTFGLFAVWAVLESSSLNAHKSIIRAGLAEATPRTTAIFCLVLFAMVAVTWRNLVSGMWPTLTGRKGLSIAIGFAFMAGFCVLGSAGAWVYQHPAYHELFFSLLPWIVGAVIVMKLVASMYLSFAIQKRGLVSPKNIRMLAVGWLLLAGCLMGLLSFYFPLSWKLAAIVAMTIPYASFAAMPLALDWNRHR
jgi:hypothetical protein